jgi:hypothetical protein
MPDEPILQNIYNTLFKLIPNYMSVAETKVMPEGAPRPDPLEKKTIIKGALESAAAASLTDDHLRDVAAEEAKGADTQKILLEKKLTSDDIDKINECLNIKELTGVTVDSVQPVNISNLFESGPVADGSGGEASSKASSSGDASGGKASGGEASGGEASSKAGSGGEDGGKASGADDGRPGATPGGDAPVATHGATPGADGSGGNPGGGGKPKLGGGKTHKNIPVGLINSKKNKPKNSLKKNNQKSNIKTKKN